MATHRHTYKMLRPIIDEYALAKLMNRICSTKFTDEWLQQVKMKYQSTFVSNESGKGIEFWKENEQLVVQSRLTDNGCNMIASFPNTEATVAVQQQTRTNSAPGPGPIGVSNNNSQVLRDRLSYMKNLEEIISFIVSQIGQMQLNQTSKQSPDAVQLLQDIRTYFHIDSSPILLTRLQQQQSFTEMISNMTLDGNVDDQRSRHYSSISDGSSSSDSSNNVTNYQQFENILQRIFKIIQISKDNSSSAGNLDLDQMAYDAMQAVRAVEEVSSGCGRSSSASSSNDSANPLSLGNAPTLGSLAVNIGSILSDSGNGSPTPSYYRTKNSSSSASSLTHEQNALELKEYLDLNVFPELRRERLNANPMDEMFRLNDRISPVTSFSSHDSQMPPMTNAGLYFDDGRFNTDRFEQTSRTLSQWNSPTTLVQETNYSSNNQCFVLSTSSDRSSRSFSVGTREQNKMLPIQSRSNFKPFTTSFGNNISGFNRKKFYELIVGQLYFDGHHGPGDQIVLAEGLTPDFIAPNSRLHSLVMSGLKNETNNGTFEQESEAYLQFPANETDAFFTPNSFDAAPTPSSVSASRSYGEIGPFNRSNSVSVSVPNSNSTLANKMFISNRSQSQVTVKNTMNIASPTVPMTAPALLDNNNFMLNETAIKNINQLAIKHIEQQQQSLNNNFIPKLIPPTMLQSRLNQMNTTPSHTTGNGKTHEEMSIKVKFGNLGNGINQFSSPHGFCLGFNEELVIADTTNNRICIYDKQGKYKSSFGISGREEGQLYNPRKIATITLNRGGQESQCYVICDRGSERSRMQIFTRSGSFVRKILITFMEIVAGIVVNAQNQIVVVDSVHPTVFALNEKGKIEDFFDCSNHMREPSDIAIYKNEYYICDFKGHCVVVFTPTGECLRKVGMFDVTNYPNGIDISPTGEILVGDSHGNRFHLAIFNQEGKLLVEYECPQVKVSRCCGLKLTREGYIVTLAKNNHHVLVLNPLVHFPQLN